MIPRHGFGREELYLREVDSEGKVNLIPWDKYHVYGGKSPSYPRKEVTPFSAMPHGYNGGFEENVTCHDESYLAWVCYFVLPFCNYPFTIVIPSATSINSNSDIPIYKHA